MSPVAVSEDTTLDVCSDVEIYQNEDSLANLVPCARLLNSTSVHHNVRLILLLVKFPGIALFKLLREGRAPTLQWEACGNYANGCVAQGNCRFCCWPAYFR